MDFKERDDLNLSIVVLRPKTLELLSSLLNPTKIFRTDEGVCRDWHGLVDLCCIPGEHIPNIDHDPDPTCKALKVWHSLAMETTTVATVANLLNYLEKMDRTDVVDDSLPLIEEDIKCYKEKKPIPKNIESSHNLGLDNNVLTFDDITRVSEGRNLQFYDAMVLFTDEDTDFATDVIINTLEQEYHLKLFFRQRDLFVGEVEHDTLIKMITERCRALIIILSNEFLKSEPLTFFYRLAQSVSFKTKPNEMRIKVLPCMYKKCDNIPPELMCYYKLNFEYHASYKFDQLYKSITGSESARSRRLPISDSVANTKQLPAIQGSSATVPSKIEPSTSADNSECDKGTTNGKKSTSVFQKVKSLVSKSKLRSSNKDKDKMKRHKKKAVLA